MYNDLHAVLDSVRLLIGTLVTITGTIGKWRMITSHSFSLISFCKIIIIISIIFIIVRKLYREISVLNHELSVSLHS